MMLLSGGQDVAPDRYGADPHPATGVVHPDRDVAELAVLDRALGLGLPLLGVCRGAQLLSVAFGGTLHQHLPDVVGHDGLPHPASSRLSASSSTRPGSGPPSGRTCRCAHHHQAVDALGQTWSRQAGRRRRSRGDGRRGPPFVVGVQWHPRGTRRSPAGRGAGGGRGAAATAPRRSAPRAAGRGGRRSAAGGTGQRDVEVVLAARRLGEQLGRLDQHHGVELQALGPRHRKHHDRRVEVGRPGLARGSTSPAPRSSATRPAQRSTAIRPSRLASSSAVEPRPGRRTTAAAPVGRQAVAGTRGRPRAPRSRARIGAVRATGSIAASTSSATAAISAGVR